MIGGEKRGVTGVCPGPQDTDSRGYPRGKTSEGQETQRMRARQTG